MSESGIGERHFHVDHFRPKRKYPELENDIINLFYACSICNSFKGSDWPAEPGPDLNDPCYADPSAVDYNQHVRVSADCMLESDVVAFQYMIERLFLNRAQLIAARRRARAIEMIVGIEEDLVGLLLRALESGGSVDIELMREAIVLNKAMSDVIRALHSARPYSREDLKRRSRQGQSRSGS